MSPQPLDGRLPVSKPRCRLGAASGLQSPLWPQPTTPPLRLLGTALSFRPAPRDPAVTCPVSAGPGGARPGPPSQPAEAGEPRSCIRRHRHCHPSQSPLCHFTKDRVGRALGGGVEVGAAVQEDLRASHRPASPGQTSPTGCLLIAAHSPGPKIPSATAPCGP